MKIVIDEENKKAICEFDHIIDMTGALRIERIEVWHVKNGENISVHTSEESAKSFKKRVEDIAQAHNEKVELVIERKPDIVRRNVADDEIITHIKNELTKEFNVALSETKVIVPEVK